ncbi:hypothetical protein [uncultured Methylobacterium sp.]|uniref:hypothetical protein n=1 Tax=uncultured Methylobacterium sp. TaxID=157278 RepID=UPI0035C9BC27
MARIPESGESSVVSMVEYGKRAKRIAGNTEAIAEDLKRGRQATDLRLVTSAERKPARHLTVVEPADGETVQD